MKVNFTIMFRRKKVTMFRAPVALMATLHHNKATDKMDDQEFS